MPNQWGTIYKTKIMYKNWGPTMWGLLSPKAGPPMWTNDSGKKHCPDPKGEPHYKTNGMYKKRGPNPKAEPQIQIN